MELGEALAAVQRCFTEGRYEITEHFLLEMRDDVLFFADVESAILQATVLRAIGIDAAANPKYELLGPSTDGRRIGIVCSLREPEEMLLITSYEVRERPGEGL